MSAETIPQESERAAAAAPEARPPRRRGALLLDAAVLAGALALLAFAPLAKRAADRLPRDAPAALAPLPAGARPAALRELPTGLRPGPPPRTVADLRPGAEELLGKQRAARLLRYVRTETQTPTETVAYPFRYPQLDRILSELPAKLSPQQVAAATDLGARLILLETLPGTHPGAASAAYALLDRARAGRACAPALNLLLLVASDTDAVDKDVTAEGERAWAACQGDPTAGWVLGQYQSTVTLPGLRMEGPGDPRAAPATFKRLVREFPGAPAAWAGQADTFLRAAATTPADRPWVARHLYERALASYRRAARLQASPEADLGIARALAGLGRTREAIAIQERAVAALPSAGQPQAQLVVYLEAARRFKAAAAAAQRLGRVAANAPRGAGLFPAIEAEASFDHEDVYGPISLGATRLAPLSVTLNPRVPNYGGTGSVDDLSFIPAFRESPGVTGSLRWCADWARRRDLILTDRAADALVRFPEEFPSPRGHPEVCSIASAPIVAGIARLELGDRRAAAAKAADEIGLGRRGALRLLQDERQNLWRWAGNLPRAERAARQWVALEPSAALPLLRLAEIEFRARRYDDAARDFGAAARRARERTGAFTGGEAQGLLGRGAALVAAGRREEGLQALRDADDVASRATAAAPRTGNEEDLPDPGLASISYYARVQLGEAYREAGAKLPAADAYAAARERVAPILESGSDVHFEQLENNAAIVDISLGRFAAAEAATRRALDVDPENPVFLMTAAFAAAKAGHRADAIRLNAAALAADPTTYPAANDLGVLLARAGRDDAAVAALRRAVGGDGEYALGWFNLGVVLAGMGPANLLASQGALARAFTLEPALRDREREPQLDMRTYRTGLDVSQPLPPEWSFAESQRHAPAKTVGLVALLMAAFGLSRGLAARGSGRGLAQDWLERLDRGVSRVPVVRHLRHPLFAIAATLAVFVWPLARDPGGGATAALAGALGLVILIAVALRGRAAAARREPDAERQQAWPTGMGFGLGASAFGLSWAPLPVLGPKASARLHWAAPVAVAAVALPLVLATAWEDIPLIRSLTAAALIMAASLLTPVKPVDGGALADLGGTAAGLTGVGLAVLLALGLV